MAKEPNPPPSSRAKHDGVSPKSATGVKPPPPPAPPPKRPDWWVPPERSR